MDQHCGFLSLHLICLQTTQKSVEFAHSHLQEPRKSDVFKIIKWQRLLALRFFFASPLAI